MKKIAMLALCLVCLAPLAGAAEKLKFVTIERPGFTVDLLKMPVVTDEGMSGFGKFKMATADKSTAAEISWDGEFEGTLDELELIADTLFKGTQLDTVIAERRSTANWDQVSSQGNLYNQVFIHMILRHCKQTGLLLTIGSISKDEAQAQAMHQRSAKSVTCKAGNRADFAGRQPPGTSLPATFAHHKRDNFEFLANTDGDVLLSEGGSSETLRLSMKRPELLATIYGNVLGTTLGNATAVEIAKGLDDVEHQRFSAFTGSQQEVRFAAMFCPADQQQYLLLAYNGDRKRKRADLDRMLDQIGCPSSAPGSYRSRPSACELGIDAFCERGKNDDS